MTEDEKPASIDHRLLEGVDRNMHALVPGDGADEPDREAAGAPGGFTRHFLHARYPVTTMILESVIRDDDPLVGNPPFDISLPEEFRGCQEKISHPENPLHQQVPMKEEGKPAGSEEKAARGWPCPLSPTARAPQPVEGTAAHTGVTP